MVCTAKILMQTLGKYEGKMMYHDWITYAAMLLFVMLYVTDIMVMNLSVSLYSQLYVIPLQETLIIVFNLLSGGLILGEFRSYSSQEFAFVLAGCCLTVFGLMVKTYFDDFDEDSVTEDQDDLPPQGVDDTKDFESDSTTTKLGWSEAVKTILHRK